MRKVVIFIVLLVVFAQFGGVYAQGGDSHQSRSGEYYVVISPLPNGLGCAYEVFLTDGDRPTAAGGPVNCRMVWVTWQGADVLLVVDSMGNFALDFPGGFLAPDGRTAYYVTVHYLSEMLAE